PANHAASAASAVPPVATTSPNAPVLPCSASTSPTTRPSTSLSISSKATACGPPAACATSASTPSFASPIKPATTPNASTTRWSPTYRSTRPRPMKPGPSWEKKDKHCNPDNPADHNLGSWWDHILIDADSRLIVTLVIGRRTTDTVYQAFTDF